MKQTKGITLVELLIVIAIIGLLLQLLLPATQMARESARRTHCQNNLHQIGLATLLHEEATGRFPTGGWSKFWIGDPDRGNDRKQPGGWIYNLLPYIEQQPLHDLGAGETEEGKKLAATKLMQTAVPVFNCPSRRLSRLYPFTAVPGVNFDSVEKAAKTDYAGNAGEIYPIQYYDGGPTSLEEADSGAYDGWDHTSEHTGVIFQISEVRMAEITDGTHQTYLVGEKFLDSRVYKTGSVPADDSTMYVGYDTENLRLSGNSDTVFLKLMHDNSYLETEVQPGDKKPDNFRFGSIHPSGCNFVFCDGSVRQISFSIDPEINRRHANRQDGEIIEADEP